LRGLDRHIIVLAYGQSKVDAGRAEHRGLAGMERRDFLIAVAGAFSLWPVTVRAQKPRDIGVLMSTGADDPEGQKRIAAFLQALGELGWTDGRNVRINLRWSAGDPDVIRKHAMELVASMPDVILASGGSVASSVLQISRTVPTVFTLTPDPVGAGFVDSLARPGGNATGFTNLDYSMSGKWLGVLKEIAPQVTRAAVLRDPALPQGLGAWGAIQTTAPSVGIEVSPVNVRDAGEIERAITAFARTSNGGLIVPGSGLALAHRSLILALAAQHRLPAVYFDRLFVTEGGLISYGSDTIDPHRRAAGYVDRILKGEKPADLPVQAPTRYQLVINLKTTKALGLTVPQTLLARADELID
jgi:putative ABC transport system substrate-binding protein